MCVSESVRSQVFQTPDDILLLFQVPWCPRCVMIDPIFDKLAKGMGNLPVKLVKIGRLQPLNLFPFPLRFVLVFLL